MIFDTHAHYDDKQFDKDRKALLDSMKEGGVGTIVNSGATLSSCKRSIELAGQYPFMYASVGIHPDEAGSLNEETFAWLKDQLTNEKVVAVGEIGLDYYWDREQHDTQKKWFIRQLGLARDMQLPVVIHSRDAAEDTMAVLKEHAADLKCDIHCYSYSLEMVREYMKMGYYIGVGGVVTFSNAKKLKRVVAEVPVERILLETDCPYLAPSPHRGKRNSSLNLKYVAEEIGQLKGMSCEEVIAQTEKNAREFYGIAK
ncbi:MAG: TatD family hydrolase [Hespellia sp.]|nr:TatD family hydrolase [Hespellia sp.]